MENYLFKQSTDIDYKEFSQFIIEKYLKEINVNEEIIFGNSEIIIKNSSYEILTEKLLAYKFKLKDIVLKISNFFKEYLKRKKKKIHSANKIRAFYKGMIIRRIFLNKRKALNQIICYLKTKEKSFLLKNFLKFRKNFEKNNKKFIEGKLENEEEKLEILLKNDIFEEDEEKIDRNSNNRSTISELRLLKLKFQTKKSHKFSEMLNVLAEKVQKKSKSLLANYTDTTCLRNSEYNSLEISILSKDVAIDVESYFIENKEIFQKTLHSNYWDFVESNVVKRSSWGKSIPVLKVFYLVFFNFYQI